MIPVWNGPIGSQRADIREARSMRQQGLIPAISFKELPGGVNEGCIRCVCPM